MKIRFIQDFIDRMRDKVQCLDLFVIREGHIRDTKNFHTLIVGSSHIFGYKTKEGELNAAMTSQDLYSSYMMYKKLNHSGLKNIIVSFSVFSPGFCIAKTIQLCQMSILYKLFYGIDYEYEDFAREKGLYQKEKYYTKMMAKYRKEFSEGKFKKKPVRPRTDEKYITSRTASHFKNNQREPDEMRWCEAIIKLAKENGQRVFFYIPPATSVYKDRLPSSDILFKKLYDICEKYDNVKIINYYDSKEIVDSDFADCDHLSDDTMNNPENKKCMTEKIREIVNSAV